MKTSWDVTIWVGEDVNIVHTTTGGTHTITISGDETGRVALQFLDGLDGLVSFRDEISRVVGTWVPPMPDEDLAVSGPACSMCEDGNHPAWLAERKSGFPVRCERCSKRFGPIP